MNIDKNEKLIIDLITDKGYKCIIVGGYVRDKLLELKPKDCDFATNCPYEELIEIFKDCKPKEIGKSFGIIQIKIDGIEYEIAKFRVESKYKNRKPTEVYFTDSFFEDVTRRDLTINGLGFDGEKIIDHVGGVNDLENKIIRFIGNADLRIQEDPLRLLRCIRFYTRYNDFEIHPDSFSALKNNSHLIKNISKERINIELTKILLSKTPSKGIIALQKTGLLKHIIPELDRCYGYNQNNSHHDKDLFYHLLNTLDSVEPDLHTRLAALFHDVAKPDCYTEDGNGEGHYYLHHKLSSDMSENILKRLKYDNKTIEIVKKLIHNHMNKSSIITPKAVKRFINRVNKENLDKIFNLMKADIISHKPPHNFESLENLKNMCYDAINSKEPTKRSELAINGNDIMETLKIKPSKIIGELLEKCTEIVLEKPHLNNKEYLLTICKIERS